MEWALLSAKTVPAVTPGQVEALTVCARDFRLKVENLGQQETKDWVSEFQSNMNQTAPAFRSGSLTAMAPCLKTLSSVRKPACA